MNAQYVWLGVWEHNKAPFVSMKKTVSVLTVPIFSNLVMMNKRICY